MNRSLVSAKDPMFPRICIRPTCGQWLYVSTNVDQSKLITVSGATGKIWQDCIGANMWVGTLLNSDCICPVLWQTTRGGTVLGRSGLNHPGAGWTAVDGSTPNPENFHYHSKPISQVCSFLPLCLPSDTGPHINSQSPIISSHSIQSYHRPQRVSHFHRLTISCKILCLSGVFSSIPLRCADSVDGATGGW